MADSDLSADEWAKRDAALDRVSRSLHRLIQGLGGTTSARMAQVLWVIAEEQPATFREILAIVKAPEKTVRADLRILGHEGYRMRRGLGLVAWRWADGPRPYKEYCVTPQGFNLVEEVEAILRGRSGPSPDTRCP